MQQLVTFASTDAPLKIAKFVLFQVKSSAGPSTFRIRVGSILDSHESITMDYVADSAREYPEQDIYQKGGGLIVIAHTERYIRLSERSRSFGPVKHPDELIKLLSLMYPGYQIYDELDR